MSNTLSTAKPNEQPQREQDSREPPCSLVLYSSEGTVTVTKYPNGELEVELFDQRTIRLTLDREDAGKLGDFLSLEPVIPEHDVGVFTKEKAAPWLYSKENAGRQLSGAEEETE